MSKRPRCRIFNHDPLKENVKENWMKGTIENLKTDFQP